MLKSAEVLAFWIGMVLFAAPIFFLLNVYTSEHNFTEATRPKQLTSQDRTAMCEQDQTGRAIPQRALSGPMGINTQAKPESTP